MSFNNFSLLNFIDFEPLLRPKYWIKDLWKYWDFWFSGSWEEEFARHTPYFHCFVIISPKCLSIRKLCIKFCVIWTSNSWEKVKITDTQTGRQTDRQTNERTICTGNQKSCSSDALIMSCYNGYFWTPVNKQENMFIQFSFQKFWIFRWI